MRKKLFLIPTGLIAFILYFTIFGDRGLLRIYHLKRDISDVQQRLKDVSMENDRLKREIEALKSDRRYLEGIARRDFGFVRNNEIIYQFPSQEQQPAKGPSSGQQKGPTATGDKPKK